MQSIYSLDETNQSALLEGIALLAKFFWGPAAEDGRNYRQGNYLAPFKALKQIVAYDPPDVTERLIAFNASFSDKNDIFQCLEQDYVRLFINSLDGIAAPLYASCYASGTAPGGDAALMGPAAIKMKERFESKGLSLGDHIHEPPDHLSIEIEYLYFLLNKGWSDGNPALIDEAVTFTAESMLPWVTRFHEKIAPVETECRFYQLIAALLCSILRFIGGSEKP
jgi:TorA-specific chaperone